ncbi:GTP-binding protein RAD, partial [Dufourea novaeangliae]
GCLDGRGTNSRSGSSSRSNGTDLAAAAAAAAAATATASSATTESQSQQTSRTGGSTYRHNGTENSRENDLLSHAASALRRLHFKSAGGSRSCRTVPKVVVMGSSTASETTINTSTDSANTMLTMVTTTDGEQPDDSFDLVDIPSEMSPPAPLSSTAPTAEPDSRGSPGSPGSSTPLEPPPPPPPPPLPLSSPIGEYFTTDRTGMRTTDHPLLSASSTVRTDQITARLDVRVSSTSNLLEDTDSPPVAAAILTNETRLSTSGRTPPLPDLRTTNFFSTPVRGSVDAGQPDPDNLNSMLTLIVGKAHEDIGRSDRSYGLRNNASSSESKHGQRKPNINVTTNPLDISLAGACTSSEHSSTDGPGRTSGSKLRGRAAGNNAAGSKRATQAATIVVQQPSLSLDGSTGAATTILLHPEVDVRRREENMRQLLDVANTLTLQEIHDFEMRYGSPHHSRSQSVKTPGSRSSGRPNYLCLPQQRSRVASMPNTGVEEEYYRLRHFSITGKGVVNRGDSLKSRRSRSNNSVASSNSSTEHLTASYPGSARNSAAGSLASSRESSASQGWKSSLVSQFMTSEYLHAYDTSIDDESGEKTVSVLLAGEESELTFIDHSCAEITPETCIATYEPHAYCVVYSTTDRGSVRIAEEVLQTLWRSDHVSARAVILVGNKVDLVRSRLVSTAEGKSMATSYDCKFIETSVGINHNVDELLVGLLTQIRLKLENPERTRDLFRKRSRKNRSKSPLGSCSENNSPKKYRGSRTSTSLKVRNLLGKVWARDSKSKSCENLHVL